MDSVLFNIELCLPFKREFEFLFKLPLLSLFYLYFFLMGLFILLLWLFGGGSIALLTTHLIRLDYSVGSNLVLPLLFLFCKDYLLCDRNQSINWHPKCFVQLNLHLLRWSDAATCLNYSGVVVSIGVSRKNRFTIPLFLIISLFQFKWVGVIGFSFFPEPSPKLNHFGLKFSDDLFWVFVLTNVNLSERFRVFCD